MIQLKWYKDYQGWSLQFFKKYWKYNVLLVLIFFLIFLINIHYSNKEEEEYAKKYPYYNSSTIISGIIEHLEKPSMRRGGGIEFKLNDEKGYTLGWAINNSYYPSDISDFVQVGDSINKTGGTDSVLIYRNEDVYYFVISKRINQEGYYY